MCAVAAWPPWWWFLILACCHPPAWAGNLTVIVKHNWHDCHAVVADNGSFELSWYTFPCMHWKKNSVDGLKRRLIKTLAHMSLAYRWSDIQGMTLLLTVSKYDRPKPSENLGVYRSLPFPVQFVDEHHLLHAAHAFYTSAYDRSLVVTMDGCGVGPDCGSFAIWWFCRTCGQNSFRKLMECSSCRFGALYHALSAHVNIWEVGFHSLFTPPDHAYFIALRQVIVKASNFRTLKTASDGYDAFFRARPPDTPARMSASQKAVEKHTLQQVRAALLGLRELHGVQGIAFGGGAATNSRLLVAVGQALNLSVWRPPMPGDGSLGFGQLWRAAPLREGRPVVTFHGDPLPPKPQTVRHLQCTEFQAVVLAEHLRRKAQVGWWVGRADLGRENGALSSSPGHRSLVSCYPIPAERLPRDAWAPRNDPRLVLMDATLVHKYFHSPTPVASPSHAFLLQARDRLKELFNTSYATVAPVEAAQDPSVDHLLTAAQACPLPLLFTRPLTVEQLSLLLDNGTLQHLRWENDFCLK